MKNLLKFSSVLAIVSGVLMLLGGGWGIKFTYDNVVREGIVTPADASIPNVPVRGPLTLKAQADAIRMHVLHATNGQTYAQMPQKIAELSADGSPVLDENGQPVMVANTARDIWVTATTLTTALNLGIVTYMFSGLILLFGLISIWTGIVFLTLSRRY